MRCLAPAILVLLFTACSGQGEKNEVVSNDAAAMGNDGDAAGAPSVDASVQQRGNRSAADDDDDGEDRLAIVPARFHGEWNSDRAACGTGTSETRLRVSGDRLRFYESVGTVRRVEVENDRVIDVTAEYEGEGQTWQNERRLGLSADGDSLTVTGEGSSLVRYRCR